MSKSMLKYIRARTVVASYDTVGVEIADHD